MNEPDPISDRRRQFLAACAFATAQLNTLVPARAQSGAFPSAAGHVDEQAGRGAFGSTVKQIRAGVLNVGYVEAGPQRGRAVVLLHGWPYDIHSYAEVTPRLVAAGYRVIVPHLRGHGTTRFLLDSSFRNGQQTAVALDILALMDSLKLQRAVLAGYDWGARTANIIAALWPDRVHALVSVNGYVINNLERNKLPLPPSVERGWWYQYYFATERGRAGLTANRGELAKLIWKTNSPKWSFDDATFQRSAGSFDNADYVSIVIHNYRWRLGLAAGDPACDVLERRLAESPVISVPTVTLDGDSDGVVAASDGSATARMFSHRKVHRVLKGVGHNVPQEAPAAFANAVLDLAGG